MGAKLDSQNKLLHPHRDGGGALDATFEVQECRVYSIVYHHKAGARGSEGAVNADYHEGLLMLLQRLAGKRAVILGIAVDSSVARKLPEAERRLDLAFPIDLVNVTDIRNLRLQITRAQKGIARRPGSQPVGGNDQKRIRLMIALGELPVTHDRLVELLVLGPAG